MTDTSGKYRPMHYLTVISMSRTSKGTENGQNMLLACMCLCFVTNALAFPRNVPIGGLFDADEMIRVAFEASINGVNENVMVPEDLNEVFLTPRSLDVDTDPFSAAESTCKLTSMGIAAIFGPQDRTTAKHVQSMCDNMDIPHLVAHWDPEHRRGNVINLYPHSDTISRVFQQLVEGLQWKSYAILYDHTDGLIRTSRLLELKDLKEYRVEVFHIGAGPNFRKVLQEVKKSGLLNMVIDCSADSLAVVLRQAQQVGIMTALHSVIVTSLDLHILDLHPYQYSGVNITGLRFVNPSSPFSEHIARTLDLETLRVEAALTYDAVRLFAAGFARLRESVSGSLKKLMCNDTRAWEHGESLSNFIRTEEMQGLTGKIKFDSNGHRSDINLDIITLRDDGLHKIGDWHSDTGIHWYPKIQLPGLIDERSLKDKNFLVLISLTEPYGMLRESTQTMWGNERYEGFAIDIIQEMSNILGFNYTFEVQDVYGSYQKESGTWNGMIGKIMNDEAHLAITDLTITADRESAVDFTTPFLNLGISVLYRKPTHAPPGLLSFLLPYSNEVWLYLLGAYVMVSSLLLIVGRLCPVEWRNPYPCIKEPKHLENAFTIKDTPFFIVGSLLKGPTGFAPAGISTRAVATSWWFFCLLVSYTYMANLAAALSTKAVVWPFKTAEELAFQNKIKYGAKIGGSTLSFFRESTYPPYKKMYRYMMDSSQDLLPSSNEAGLKKVQQENFAFFMESSSITYFKQRNCNVTQVGGLLDAKGYGIAMKKNAPYRPQLSGAILKLKESGMINELYDKWWKQKRGGDKCEEKEAVKVSPLNLEDVGGIFVILTAGVGLSWVFTCVSFLWNVRTTAIERNVSFTEELMEEVKFLVTCSSRKSIKRR